MDEQPKKPRKVKIEDMPHADQVEAAKNSALNTLSMVGKTRGELEDKLTKKGYPEAAIAEALDRLVEVGVVDDAAFARQWVSSRQGGRGLAASAIRRELMRRGVATDLIDEALEVISTDDETDKAYELVRRKVAATRGLDNAARTRRLVGMLARKGYSGSIAFSVVRAVLAEDGLEIDAADVDLD